MMRVLQKSINKIIELWYILVLLIIGFIFRFFLMKYQYVISFDEVNYLKLATYGALNGLTHVFHTYWSPFYPFVVAILLKIIGNFEFTARFVSVLCGSLVIVPVYLLARYRLTKKTSIITIAMLALYPPLSFLSTKILTEPLYMFLGITGILIAWYSLQKESRVQAFWVGIIFGMTYLTRPEGIGFILVFIMITLLLFIKNLIERKKNTYIQLILFSVLGFIIISSPYLLYLHKKTGEWTISEKRKSLQQAEADVFKNQEKDRLFRKLSEDNKSLLIDQMFHIGNFITAEVERGEPVVQVTLLLMMKKYFKNVYELMNMVVPEVIPLTLAVFFILGFFVTSRAREKIVFDLYLLSFIIFFWGIVIPLFHINYRYFLPLLPIFFIWIGRGVVLFYSWLENILNKFILIKRKKVYVQFLSFLLVGYFILFFYVLSIVKIINVNADSKDRWSKPIEYKTAGLWLKDNCTTPPIVMSHYQTVSYYAGNYNITESVSIPFNNIDRVLKYAKYREVDYIILSERYSKLFPLIENLFHMEDIPEDLKVAYHFESKSGLKVVIYKLMYDK